MYFYFTIFNNLPTFTNLDPYFHHQMKKVTILCVRPENSDPAPKELHSLHEHSRIYVSFSKKTNSACEISEF